MALLKLLEGGGDAAPSFSDLAKAAGVARQTVYTHFPDRGALFVGLADYARRRFDAEALAAPIFTAPTALEALGALVDFHMAYTVKVLNAYRAVELEQARDPAVAHAFRQRGAGRQQIARHVVTRLQAEGCLAQPWTIDTASDFVAALLTASFSAALLEGAGWKVGPLRDHLLLVLRRSLVTTSTDTTERADHDV